MTRIALVAAAAGLLVACGTAGPAIDEALLARLESRNVSVRWVRCLASGIEEAGQPVYRCTVNFGDPHLVPYCAALLDGELVTDREQPELRCYPPEEEARYRENAGLD